VLGGRSRAQMVTRWPASRRRTPQVSPETPQPITRISMSTLPTLLASSSLERWEVVRYRGASPANRAKGCVSPLNVGLGSPARCSPLFVIIQWLVQAEHLPHRDQVTHGQVAWRMAAPMIQRTEPPALPDQARDTCQRDVSLDSLFFLVGH